MKKTAFWITVLILMALTGCVKKPGKKLEGGLAEHRTYDISFWGYKRSLKVKAAPELVDQYLLDPNHLVVASQALKLKIEASESKGRRGDQVIYKTQVLGVPFNLKVVLWDHEPGREALMVCLLNDNIMGFIRYHLRKLEDGTRFSFEFEVEEDNPLMDKLVIPLQLDRIIMKLEDEAVDRMQRYFDPDLTEDSAEASAKGERFNKMYQTHEVAAWINAPPARVAEYMADPAFTELVRQKYNIDFGQGLTSRKPGIFPLKVNFLGTATTPDALILSYEFEKHVFVYWSGKINSRIQIFTRPEREGTRLIVTYMLEAPSNFTVDLANIMMNTAKIPKSIEAVMADIKAAVEGSG